MRPQVQKKTVDENFFGLLQVYKSNASYIRVLESTENDCISVQITDNPGKWKHAGEKYKTFRVLSRLEIGAAKLFIKFLTPSQMLAIRGPLLGIRIPAKECTFANVNDESVHIIEAPLNYKERILSGVRNILTLSPHKKLEIIEMSLHQGIQGAEIS
jgi:hypothetical protein